MDMANKTFQHLSFSSVDFQIHSCTMRGEGNRPLVTDESVEFEKYNWLKFKTLQKLRTIVEESIEYASKRFDKGTAERAQRVTGWT